MTTVIALLGRAAAEALFYVLVAGWYLLCIQWDVIDVLLGGPDLNRRHAGSRREQAVEAAGLEAALSWSKGKAPPKTGAGKPPAGAADQPGAALTPEAIAANAAAQVDADACCTQAGGVKTLDSDGYMSAEASGPDPLDAALLQEQRGGSPGRRLSPSTLSRFGSQGSVGTEAEKGSLYGRLKRKLPRAADRLNVKQRMQRRIAEYSAELLPDFAASIGVEAAAGTLAAALPGGVRDAGVRAVDRAEAGLRRWALFVGGAGFLFRVLLWH